MTQRQTTGRVEGKVALVTGAARGQGRSHAITVAGEGADIIAVDIEGQVDSVPYPMSNPEDMERTVKEVEALDRRIVATKADVRDFDALKQALDDGVAQLGRLDIVSANAGIVSYGQLGDLLEQTWQDVIDTNLTGVCHTAKGAIPDLRAAGRGVVVSEVFHEVGGVFHHAGRRDGRQARTRKVAPTPPGPRSTIRTATGGSSKRSRRGSPVGNRKGVAATLSVKEVRHVPR